jgi:Tfp pilus assembly protein PilV
MHWLDPARRALPARPGRGGFSLLEATIAASLLAAGLIVMFGFHGQAVRSNMTAHRLTDCTNLAQAQVERLMLLPWNGATNRPSDLDEAFTDAASLDETGDLVYGADGADASGYVNAAFGTDTAAGAVMYRVTYDVEDMDADGTWIRLRVRCTYTDPFFNLPRGLTVSTFRYRDS